ncbi:hypothetical protein PA598K_03957 [Paenibacillus sp. 598K]|uniref:hypothetical protein n=1 Tax=Paenibacillus sp. 598K TaxID=1117987 RepID=UPI000FFA0CAA|nr:hypothetical protein [Paenibacillus sp. 598K]GBF75540.1 hypothetical protein PA598K_03957 [Paenibacillus sp. 598K]
MRTSIRRLSLLSLLSVALLASGFGVMRAPTAHALSCVGFTVEEAYERYEAVIVGQVDAIEPFGNKGELNQAEVTVLRSFKTIEDRQLSVLESATWGAGFAPSEVGGQYLMYLNKTADGWEQPLCSPGMQIEHKAEDLKWLEDKEIPLKPLNASDDVPDSDLEAPVEGSGVDTGENSPQERVTAATVAADGMSKLATVESNSSRVIWTILFSISAVLAGAAVWMYAARNRKGKIK